MSNLSFFAPDAAGISGRCNYKMQRAFRKSNDALTQLVGIEPNPGPRSKASKRAANSAPYPVPRRRQRRPRTSAPSVGARLGAMVGDAAQKMFKRITGFGDYTINSNSLVTDNSPPIFAKNGRGIVIKHREYIGDISGSTGFTINGYPINPGMPQTFPWLSAVASSFEQYSFKGLVFEFKSTSASALNSTNTALGTVIMATEYDSKKPPFSSKLQMENYEFATSTKPAESSLHPVECNPAESTLTCLYTRQPTTPVSDLRMSDLGQFYIATVGMQAAAVIGELWCTYEVELLKPRIDVVPAVNAMVEYVNPAATVADPLVGSYLQNYAVGNIAGISGVSFSNVSGATDRVSISNAGLIGSYIHFEYHFFAPGENSGLAMAFSNPIGCSLVNSGYFPEIYSSAATSYANTTVSCGVSVLVTSSTFSVDVTGSGTAALTGAGPYGCLRVFVLN